MAASAHLHRVQYILPAILGLIIFLPLPALASLHRFSELHVLSGLAMGWIGAVLIGGYLDHRLLSRSLGAPRKD